MKEYKIYTEENYFYIVDTITTKVYEAHKKNVLVLKDIENKGIFRFRNVDGFKETIGIKIDNIQKQNGSYYTYSEFESFYKQNTGNFNSASGGSGAVSSVFGRIGDVNAQNGDYTTAQITESANKKFVTDSEKSKITEIDNKTDKITVKTTLSDATYTLTNSDVNKVIVANNTSIAITVNDSSINRIGDVIYIDYFGTGTCEIEQGSTTLLVNANDTLFLDGQYSRVAIQKMSATQMRVFGQLIPA